MELREFTKHDWNSYAGVEGDNPKIGEIPIPGFEDTDAYVVVVDKNCLEVDKVTMGDMGDNRTWLFTTDSQEDAEFIASLFDVNNIERLLKILKAEVLWG